MIQPSECLHGRAAVACFTLDAQGRRIRICVDCGAEVPEPPISRDFLEWQATFVEKRAQLSEDERRALHPESTLGSVTGLKIGDVLTVKETPDVPLQDPEAGYGYAYGKGWPKPPEHPQKGR